jgi:hypothetical protein
MTLLRQPDGFARYAGKCKPKICANLWQFT